MAPALLSLLAGVFERSPLVAAHIVEFYAEQIRSGRPFKEIERLVPPAPTTPQNGGVRSGASTPVKTVAQAQTQVQASTARRRLDVADASEQRNHSTATATTTTAATGSQEKRAKAEAAPAREHDDGTPPSPRKRARKQATDSSEGTDESGSIRTATSPSKTTALAQPVVPSRREADEPSGQSDQALSSPRKRLRKHVVDDNDDNDDENNEREIAERPAPFAASSSITAPVPQKRPSQPIAAALDHDDDSNDADALSLVQSPPLLSPAGSVLATSAAPAPVVAAPSTAPPAAPVQRKMGDVMRMFSNIQGKVRSELVK